MLQGVDRFSARILIVDDMATNRALAKYALAGENYDFIEAVDGVDALEKIMSHELDVVLLDIMMPNMDGLDVLNQIRNDAKYRLLPFIMLTTLDAPADIVQSLDMGASDYVAKPFNAVELKARVKAAVERKQLTDSLDDAESVLFSLARMVEARDGDTGDHCDRLAHTAVVFGKELGLNYEQLEALRRGGVLHDIGKLGIPDHILLKKGKLTGDEWEIMKQHPVIGAALCAPLRSMQLTVDIVACHHERWNGSGYPNGLQGEAIPLLARIFQIVDVYDALSSERPYKPAFSAEKVKQILLEETEKGCWDPRLMEKFIDILDHRRDSLQRPETLKCRSAVIKDQIFELGMQNWYQQDSLA